MSNESLCDLFGDFVEDEDLEARNLFHNIFTPYKDLAQKLDDEDFLGHIRNAFAEFQIIGVFGPYRGDEDADARDIIQEICTYVARKEYIVLTGRGYHHPALPEIWRNFNTILPDSLQGIFDGLENAQFLSSFLLPYLIKKAICRMVPQRSQVFELEGCFLMNKEVLGFADHKDVIREPDKCDWVDHLLEGQNITKRCTLKPNQTCPKDADRDTYCIFYIPHEILGINKYKFNKKGWKYYSLNDYTLIYPIIENYL